MNPIKTEPVLTAGTITALAGAILLLLTEFGIPLTEGQQVAILGVFAIVAPLILAAVGRSQVTPVGGIGSDNSGDQAEPYEPSPEGERLDADGDGTPDTR